MGEQDHEPQDRTGAAADGGGEGARIPGPLLRRLKSRGQLLKPVVHLGKGGLTPDLVRSVEQALSDHELIKVRFEALKDQRKTLVPELARLSRSAVVLQVGHTVVLYREHPDPERRSWRGS